MPNSRYNRSSASGAYVNGTMYQLSYSSLITVVYTQRIKTNFDCNYTFMIGLVPNGIPFGAKLIRKVQLQYKFGLIDFTPKGILFGAKSIGKV